MKLSTSFGAVLLANAANSVAAIELNVQDPGSIKSVASTLAYGLVDYYKGNVTNTPETIAILPPPHYWWQAGAMWGLLLDYYHFTGDGRYNAITTQALLSQVGPKNDFMMPLYELQEANDDQAFWGFASMSAAEKGYPEPPTGPTWLQLTENLWNTQVYRWDMSTCGGGLKWQIFDFNKGYFYKNSVSNGAFFQLSARLARFTGNQTYFDWAEKSWEWSEKVGLVSPDHAVYDGTDSLKNCVDLNHIEWSYNLGIYLYGAAMLFDATDGSQNWAARTQGLLDHSAFFFSPYDNATNIMYEYACEPVHTCNYDQFSFKGYLARFMWATTLVAPFTKDTITKLLTVSASAAANSCSGGRDGVTCGAKWYTGGWDGTYGVGQQMSALETIQGLLIQNSAPPRRAQAQRKPEPVTTPSVAPPPLSTTTALPQTTKAPETTKGQSTTISSAPPASSSTSVQPTVIEISPESSTSEELLGTIEIPTSSRSKSPTSVVVSLSSSSERSTSAVVTPSSLIVISTSAVSTQTLSTEEPTRELIIPTSSSTTPTHLEVTSASCATPTSLVFTSSSFEKPNATKTLSSTSEELTTAEPITSKEPEPEPTTTPQPTTVEPLTTAEPSTSTTSSTTSTISLVQVTTRSEEPTISTSFSTESSSTTSSVESSSVESSVTSGFVTSSTKTESSEEVLTTSSSTGAVPTRAPAESLTRLETSTSSSTSPISTTTEAPSSGRRESAAWGMGASFMIACFSVLYLS